MFDTFALYSAILVFQYFSISCLFNLYNGNLMSLSPHDHPAVPKSADSTSTIPGETGRQMLAEVLASNDKLFHLDISYNAIGTEAADGPNEHVTCRRC